jgi:hypothetical protein
MIVVLDDGGVDAVASGAEIMVTVGWGSFVVAVLWCFVYAGCGRGN